MLHKICLLVLTIALLTLSGAPSLSADVIFPVENQSVELVWPEEVVPEDRPQPQQPRDSRSGSTGGVADDRSTVKLHYSDEILIMTLCDTDRTGVYEQHCEQYELVIIPFSVSVRNTGIRRLRRLRIDVYLLASPTDQRQPIIQSVSPPKKATTKELKTAPVTVTVGAQGVGFSYESDIYSGFQIDMVTSSVESGYGRSKAYWEFFEGRLSGTFQMAILAAVDPDSTYRLRVQCEVRSFLGLHRLSHGYEAVLIFPTRTPRRLAPSTSGSVSDRAGDT